MRKLNDKHLLAFLAVAFLSVSSTMFAFYVFAVTGIYVAYNIRKHGKKFLKSLGKKIIEILKF